MDRDFKAELTAAQAKVKSLAALREKLAEDERAEASRVDQAIGQLKALGVENAAELSIEDLRKLQASEQAKLVTNMDALQTQIAEAEGVMADYEAVQG
jgi:hypothetical protein